MRSLTLLLFAFAIPLHADPFADLRGALSKLTADDPIRATYEVHRAVTNQGKWANQKFNGKAAVEAGDRLVRTRIEESESGSGLGQKGSSSLVATLRVH